jgi:hypothetical protein
MSVMGVKKNRAFVMEGYLQAGGTYMAYHIGRLCYERFGLQVVVVTSQTPSHYYFDYPYRFPTISQVEMESSICADDLLICNPGFSINMFGLRLPGKKICYVQGFTSYDVLDVFYDRFAFSSRFVKEYVQKWRYYDINGPVINPFIHTEIFAGGQEREKRRPSVMVLHHKGLTKPLDDKEEQIYRHKYQQSKLTFEHYHGLRQHELANIMGHHKYYLSVSPLEGFGLPCWRLWHQDVQSLDSMGEAVVTILLIMSMP